MPAYGDLVIIVTPKGKRSLRRVDENQDMHTQDGILRMADVVEAPFGSEVCTTLGVPYRIQKPTLNDIVKGVKRQTQILYPKDIGYICMRLGVGPNRTVIEAGTGSGSLTVALSWFSGTTGKVHTFEAREEFHKLARRNLEWAGVGQNVTMHCQDIAEGFGDVTGADALFLDVRTPWDYLKHIPAAVTPGAALAFLLPTVDQVGKLLLGLEQGPFDDVEVCEILVRRWKPIADRLRPEDRMVAHTGFLIFARHQERSAKWDECRTASLGTRERKQEAARRERLGLDGMETARRVRELDKDVIIVFITNMAQYAIGGYAVGALDYVLKPVPYFAFSQQLRKAEEQLRRRARHYLALPVEGGMRRLDSSLIYYLESEGHRVHFYTEEGDFVAAGTLKAFEEKLADRPFARCNSGYLVNLAQVKSVQQGMVQVGPYELQVSRPRRKAFLAALADHIGGEGA